jgi:ribosomal RNA-processing protein 36
MVHEEWCVLFLGTAFPTTLISLARIADRKEFLTKAKFEALAESGGRSAVRKAIEKKQKKINQKEKKKRPFAPGEGRRESSKRLTFGGTSEHAGRPSKRQRTS